MTLVGNFKLRAHSYTTFILIRHTLPIYFVLIMAAHHRWFQKALKQWVDTVIKMVKFCVMQMTRTQNVKFADDKTASLVLQN